MPADADEKPQKTSGMLAVESLDEAFKDARAAFLSLVGVSAYSIIALLGIEDKDFFSRARQIALPIIGTDIRIDYFLWFSPILITIIMIYLHVLILKCSFLFRKIDSSAMGRIRAILRVPIFVRWALFEAAGRPAGAGYSYAISIALTSISPLIVLLVFWWWSHTMHSSSVSISVLVCFSVSLLIFGYTLGAVASGVESNAIFSLMFLNYKIFVVFIGFFLTAIFVFTLYRTGVFPDLRVALTSNGQRNQDGAIGINVMAPQNLQNASLADRPIGYVPRFVWAEEYLRTKAKSYPADLIEDERERIKIEDNWFATRTYYLNGRDKRELVDYDLRRSDLTDSYLSGMKLNNTRFDEAIMVRADMEAVVAERTSLRRANLDSAHLEQAFLKDADFSEASLLQASLRESHLQCTKFEKARLFQANFDGAYMEKSNLAGANLKDASLRGAYLKRANLHSVDFEGADIEGAVLWGADLREAKNLTQKQLDSAITDSETIVSEPLTVKPCGSRFIPLEPPLRIQWWMRIEFIKNRVEACGNKQPLTPSPVCQLRE